MRTNATSWVQQQAGAEEIRVGIHNTVGGAMGVSASKWGLGVFHSILGNDRHYEAPEHFMRAPERVAVMAEMFSFSFQMRRDAM